MPFFVTILVLIIALQIRLSYINKKNNSSASVESWLREDFEAGFLRKKPIDENMFVSLCEEDLPFRYDYGEEEKNGAGLLSAQEKVKHCLNAPIIKTDIPMNMEVKKRFGVANLQTVIAGEENHTRLIQRLNAWAKLLIAAENERDAEAVLERAVYARSDISETYILLYDLYRKASSSRIQELVKKIEDLPETAKKKVESHINSYNN